MYPIPRTGLILIFIGTIAIAVASTIVLSDAMLLLGIWLITLILIGYAGCNVQKRTPDEEAELERASERINELVTENSELKQADQDKNELFVRTIKELRIPLTSIDGHVELLRDQHLGRITKQQKDSLDAINQEIDRITRMIIDIIELANLETGNISLKKERISFSDIINNVTEYMQPTTELKGIRLDKEISPDLPAILGDQERLTHAFTNIIGNAIKFTSDGNVSITAHARDSELLISVSDTGTGIPEDAIDKIFDRFYKVDTTSHGTGLGLSTAKEIVELHGGRIWAESKEGEGSTVRFTIPLS
ncbi:MAG: HAMP domain-containing sensor histidine kinase [Euryarchaeota archaeon]|nr:HAMP domain-containing sensor histidine kinase [Euryarchaeota archaeon]